MEQSKALAILKSGQNVFLTGSAGTGKTWVLNEYIKYLRDRKIHVAVTASTGIAATHMQGTTIHAWSGIGVRDYLSPRVLSDLLDRKYLRKNMDGAKVLIVDEVSMLHLRQLNMVDEVLRAFKESPDPFGGIQVVFAGDFFQLPPVGHAGESNRDKFAFMSKAWLNAKPAICYLDKQYRQANNSLNRILEEIRTRSIQSESLNQLQAAAENDIGDEPTRLYSHNIDAEKINVEQLAKLDAKSVVFEAKTSGNAKLVEVLKKSVLSPEALELKVGARVMFVKNNHELGFVNGTMGEVIKFEDGLPVVQTNSGKEITAAPEKWSFNDDEGKGLASFEQIPVRLAWAITVHKSQGMTLDAAEVDLRKTFEKGQGYVALSRLRGLDTLKLNGFNEVALMVDGLAFKADKRFRELSSEAENQFSEEELESQAKSFVVLSDGLTDEKAIERYRKKKADKQSQKNTYDVTAEYVEQGMTLQEIATERGLALGTVIGHLPKISSKTDTERFRPAATLMAKVRKAHKAIVTEQDPDKFMGDGGVKIGAMHRQLQGKHSYDEIKLAMVFL